MVTPFLAAGAPEFHALPAHGSLDVKSSCFAEDTTPQLPECKVTHRLVMVGRVCSPLGPLLSRFSRCTMFLRHEFYRKMYYSSRRGTQMSRVYVFALIILHFVAFVVSALSPRKIVWSETSYEPDGPWQAVTVSIGNPSQPIDLFPGGFWASNILESSVCNNTLNQPVCYAQAAGLYNSSASVDSISHYQTGGL